MSVLRPCTEADDAALLFQFLVAIGNVVGRNAYFVAEADRHYPNLFAVLVGKSSKGRKGSSLSRIRSPLGGVDHEWAENCQANGLSSGEGLIWAVRDPITKREPIREKGRVVGYEEVESDKGILDKRLLIVEGEYAIVLKVLTREGNTLSAIVRNAWDTGMLRTLTKNSPAIATNAHISLIGHITQSELVRYLDDTEAGNGFGNRFLWIAVKRSKLLPDGGTLNSEALRRVSEKIADAIEFGKQPRQIHRDAHARDLWHAVYPALSEGRPGLLGSMTARAEAQVMRLALIYALLDRSELICEKHLRSALACWRYAEASAAYIFGDRLGDAVADELLGAIRCADNGMTRTEIQAHFSRHKKSGDIDRAIRVLLDLDLIVGVKDSTGGRPAERWRATNPPAKEANKAQKAPPGEDLSSHSSLNSPPVPSAGPAEAADTNAPVDSGEWGEA